MGEGLVDNDEGKEILVMGAGMSPQEAIDWLVKLEIVPYWDSLDRRVLFKKAAKRGLYHITRQSKEKTWPLIIKALRMNTEQDVKRIRDIVKSRLKELERI